MVLGYLFLALSSWRKQIFSHFRMPMLNMQVLSFPLFSPFKLDSVGLTL